MEGLIKVFGRKLISYCLNIDSEQWPESLSAQQQEVIEALKQFSSFIEEIEDDFSRSYRTSLFMLSVNEEAGISQANFLRLHCGGELPAIQTEDPVESALLSLGLDFYPVHLLPESKEVSYPEFRGAFAVPLFSHPAHKKITDALIGDDALSKLLPGTGNSEEESQLQCAAAWSNGSAQGVQLEMIPSSFLESGLNSIEEDASVADYLEALRGILNISRSLARTRTTNVPAIIGLGNIELPSGRQIKVPNGLIRKPRVGDRRLLFNPTGMTAVLEIEVPLRLLSVRVWGPDGESIRSEWFERLDQHQPTFEKFNKEMRRRIDLAKLTLLLSSPGSELIAPAEVGSTVVIPVTAGGSAAISAFRSPVSASGNSVIGEELAPVIEGWASKVISHPKNLDVAMRRILSAASTRLDPTDGFIDAIICWENIFGTGEGELTFRICGSIARILEPEDLSARKSLYDDLKKLYVERSKVVHGVKDLSSGESLNYRRRAIEIALEVIRSLYSQPEILKAENSSVRGRIVLMGY